MDLSEEKIEEEALLFIKENAKEVVKTFCHDFGCASVENPVTLFMAGSPGAGKTEVSKSFTREFEGEGKPVRIDADDIRVLCPGYQGRNAHLFQKAASKGVNILYDFILDKNINCIVDGTFAYAGAVENIERSLKRNRLVEIWFVYQDPIKAWEFTKARERKMSRHISKDVFIKSYFAAQYNIRNAKSLFGEKIRVNFLIKDYENGTKEIKFNLETEEIDSFLVRSYSKDELIKNIS